jgi:thiol:disulfide interchange protein DsbD
LAALLLAFLGGLILNIMPCVFPILTVKILAITQLSGLDQQKIRKEHLVYTGGVIFSFWILAALLSLLRYAGLELGWGFQLQWPPFVFILMLLMFLMGLLCSCRRV